MIYQEHALALALVAAVGFSLLYAGALLTRRYLALSHIPGPRVAAWTDLWLFQKYQNPSLNPVNFYIDLHKQYGPVVRYGPQRVLFSDPAQVPVIYGTTKVFEKAPSYDVPVLKVNGKLTRSIATIRDEKLLSAIKRQVTTAFSAKSMHDYEHHVDLTIEAFLDVLHVKGPYLDLMPILSFFTFDTICRLAFSDTLNLMSNQSDMDNVLQAGRDRFVYWHKWFAIPKIEGLLFKNRFTPSSSNPSKLGELAKKRFEERLEKGGVGIHQDLLDRYFQAREKDPQTFSTTIIMGMTMSTIHAGSETTAHTLANTFWDLLKHPDVYRRLKEEIRNAGFSSPPMEAEVRKVPFIEACIKESTRLHNLLNDPFERVVPPEGATIAGTWIPGGTIVGINTAVLGRDTTLYGENADQYVPDRWLSGTPQQHAAMERSNFAFSQGKRNCLGLHMAWTEMLKLLPAILNEFDIELADPNAELQTTVATMIFVKDLPVMATPRRR
ncbi:uncharacterized protein HMPREF1541_08075 [Cyphellophora europaea CBS 101466]|uniref:Uncharacterized protein n=1 Tax=Cyphellophora europaea (strain CBS 101466) TaxID=1220924 RepID=W2RL85_CYPE1|nr:uncharacterized protein HMPREF1541_08075 [Cyphellophora europaea CBS 101466]ETN37085.1 hypothetical protein HMPREF1541_08075 [Cyphellophora europaea CBS 101466]